MREMRGAWTRSLLRTTGKRLQRLALRTRYSGSLPKIDDLVPLAPDLRFLAYVNINGLPASTFSKIKPWTNLRELELGRVENVTDAQWQALAEKITKCHTLRMDLSWKQGERGTPDALRLLPPDLRELQWIEHGLHDEKRAHWDGLARLTQLEAFTLSRWNLTPEDANEILAQAVQWANLTAFSMTGYLDKLNVRRACPAHCVGHSPRSRVQVDEYLNKFAGHIPRLSSFEFHVIAPGPAPAAKTWAAFAADHKQLTSISGHVALTSQEDVALLTGLPFVELFLEAPKPYIGMPQWLSSLTSLVALNVSLPAGRLRTALALIYCAGGHGQVGTFRRRIRREFALLAQDTFRGH